jgi:hypothetical protein
VTSADAAARFQSAQLSWAAAEGTAALNLLRQVVTLADNADRLSCAEMRVELHRIAALAQRHPPQW